MKSDKWRSNAEAVPVYMQVKEAVWELYTNAIKARREYRVSHHPMDLVDFANATLSLYDVVRADVLSDKRLMRNYGHIVEPLDGYGMQMPQPHKMNAAEWNGYFHDIHGILYAMGILRITMDKDTDDDFAGVPGMEEVYQNMMKNFKGFSNGDDSVADESGRKRKKTKKNTNAG